MTKNSLIAAALIVALTGCSENAEPVETVTLAPSNLDRAATLEGAANVTEELVTYTWRLEDQPQIAQDPAPYRDVSRQFTMYLDGESLRSGVQLPLTSEGALIAITPLTRERLIDPANAVEGIALGTVDGLLEGAVAVDALANGSNLSEVGDIQMNPNMVAFTTTPEVGTGNVTLKIAEANPAAQVVVQVVERESVHALDFGADAVNYFQGDTIRFDGTWQGEIESVRVESARMRAPNGSVIDIPVANTGDIRLSGSVEVPEDVTLRPGELMELEVDTVALTPAGDEVRRTAKTAFAIGTRTAALLQERPTFEQTDEGINVPVELEVGSQGRFAVTGILYGTDENGEMHAFLGCQTATMLEPGNQTLNLTFSAEDLAGSELSAPYEVRDLRLQDQSRMVLLD